MSSIAYSFDIISKTTSVNTPGFVEYRSCYMSRYYSNCMFRSKVNDFITLSMV